MTSRGVIPRAALLSGLQSGPGDKLWRQEELCAAASLLGLSLLKINDSLQTACLSLETVALFQDPEP